MEAGGNRGQPLPLLVVHRITSIRLDIIPILRAKYTVLDPHDDPPHPSFPALSKSARLLLCVGPTPLTSDDLDRYPSVECVVSTSAGLDHFDLAACHRRGIHITGIGDTLSDDVADYAVGLAIDVLRRVSAADRYVRAGSWFVQKKYAVLGSRVSGKRVGIVGLGNIGSRVAKRFEGFGCIIAYTSRNMKPNVPYTYYANVKDLALNSDILVVSCELTNETCHMINKDVMMALGKKGIIVNIGRGALIDEKELVEVLVRGEIGGAGLDVFDDEPYVQKELWALDNVVLSPHQAFLTTEAVMGLGKLIISNIEAFFSDKPLQAEIKFD